MKSFYRLSGETICASSYRFSHEAMNTPSYRFIYEAIRMGFLEPPSTQTQEIRPFELLL